MILGALIGWWLSDKNILRAAIGIFLYLIVIFLSFNTFTSTLGYVLSLLALISIAVFVGIAQKK